jgi:PAS domain S-box-containing protein
MSAAPGRPQASSHPLGESTVDPERRGTPVKRWRLRLPAASPWLRAGFVALLAGLVGLFVLSAGALLHDGETNFLEGLAFASAALGLITLIALATLLQRLDASNRELRARTSDREQTHRRLLESQRRLQLLLDHMPDGVLSFDAAGCVQWINPAARLMFRCSAEDAVGQPVRALIPELDVVAIEVQPTRPDGMLPAATPRLATQGRRVDGATFPLDAALVKLNVDGAMVGMCVLRDMSESRRVERLKHEFVSMVSHELRTPLTSLRGSLSLLADGSIGDLPPDAQRLLKLASDNSERLVNLVNDILDFEKISAGALRIEAELLDLGQAAQQAVDAIEGMARQNEIRVKVLRTEPDTPVMADPARLMQVLANLLSNAIKYSPRHGTVLVVVSRRSERARLVVRDQGPGISEEFAARLFQPFEQATDPRHRKKGGTGLGLAISRALMEMMLGAIGLEPPKAGEGASFWVELPLHRERPSTFGNLD